MKKILILFVLLLMSMEVVTMAPKINRPVNRPNKPMEEQRGAVSRNIPAWLRGGGTPFDGAQLGGGTGGTPFSGGNAGGGAQANPLSNAQAGGGSNPQGQAGSGYNPNRPTRDPFGGANLNGGVNQPVNRPTGPVPPSPFTGAQSGAGYNPNRPQNNPFNSNPFDGMQAGGGYINAPISNPFTGAQAGGGMTEEGNPILRGDGPTLSDILRGLSMTPTPSAAPTPPVPGYASGGSGGFGSSYGGNWGRRRGGGGGGWGGGGGGYSDAPAWLNQYLNLNSWNI